MEKREFTGVFIPAHIWLSADLIPAEKMLLGEIDALSKRSGWCEASREHFAEWLQCTPTNVTHFLSKLERNGFIESISIPGKRTLRRVVTNRFFVNTPVSPTHPTREPHSPLPVSPTHPTREPHSPEIKIKENSKPSVCAPPATTTTHTPDFQHLETAPLPPPVPPAPPRWGDIPNSNTPAELQAFISRFYHANPEVWRVTIDATPAARWSGEKTRQTVARFCEWAITQGFERRPMRQISARLKTWFKDEPIVGRSEAPAPPRREVKI